MGRQLFFALDCLNTGNIFIILFIILDRVISGVNGDTAGVIHGLAEKVVFLHFFVRIHG